MKPKCLMERCKNPPISFLDDYCAECRDGVISRIQELDDTHNRRAQRRLPNSINVAKNRHPEQAFQKKVFPYHPPRGKQA